MEIKFVYIYALIDPRGGEIKYIGKTNNLSLRYNLHMSHLSKKSKKVNWIKSLSSKGLKPIIEVIDEVLETEWAFWEMHYISLFKSWGFLLVNGTNGGDGGPSPKGIKRSEETKMKMRAFALKRPSLINDKARATRELKKSQGFVRKNKPKMTDATKDKIRQSKLNMSDAYREKLKMANKGRKATKQQCLNQSIGHANQKNENLMKPIVQLSKDGCFIKEYRGIAVASREMSGGLNKCIGISISLKKGRVRYGSIWMYKKEYEIVLQGQTQMEIDNNKARNTMFEQNQKQSAELINNINTGSNV